MESQDSSCTLCVATKGVEYQLIEVTIYQILSAINATVLIFRVINILY